MKVLTALKNTGKLYLLDWKRIIKNPIAIFLMIVLMVIPSLYAWFNIKALWDPYGNTSQLPIAVYSADAGASFNQEKVEIGKEVIKNLHKNKQLGWRFVDSKKQLTEGVKSGKYYAGIYLPENFSKDLLSFTTGDIKKPKIKYYLNQKINAIAPKITDKGASSIQSEISTEFVATASDTLLKVFNQIGYDIDSNLVSINKIKNLILSTNDNLTEIDGYTQEIIDLQGKIPELKEKLAQANQLTQYLPEIDDLGQKIVTLNKNMPTIKQQASIILTLQEKIPEIQQAGDQLAQVDSDFATIEQTMNAGIDDAKQGLQVIQQVQTLLPDIEKLASQANDFAATTKSGAEELQKAVPNISSSIGVTLQSIAEVADTTNSLVSNVSAYLDAHQLTDDEKANIKQLINNFKGNITTQQTAIKNLVEFLNQLKETSDDNGNTSASQKLASLISQLNTINTALTNVSNRLTDLNELVQEGNVAKAKEYLAEVQAAATNVENLINKLDVSGATETIQTILTKLISTLTTAQGVLTQAQQIDFQSLLASTEKTVSSAITILEKYQKQLPAIKQEVHDANTILNGHMTEIVQGINTAADLYNNELPVIEKRLATAADFVQNDWPGLKNDLTKGLALANEKMPQVESALNLATDLIQNDWPSLKSGIQKAASAIEEGEGTVDLGQVIKLLKLDATQESDFFANPVSLNTNTYYPIPNNGSASTPFYTALCLWVGAVLFSSVTTTEFYLDKKDRKKFSKRELFGARMLTYLSVSVVQALIVTLGNLFILDVYTKNPVESVLFAVLVSLAFMMIVYTLVALFGTVGKGIAIIILVLSISGGGGNYPIQVSGKFFQAVNPWLPFTHAVDLLRESAGGIYWPNALPNIWILIGLFVIFGLIGTWAYPILQPHLQKLSKISHESKIFH